MTGKPRVLDLFCCQGGGAKGYGDAGFDVTGVDKDPQPRYPYRFHQGDAVEFVRSYADWIRETFAFVHASPPCQFDSDCQRIMDRDHPDLIGPTRDVLEMTGLPYVIENVEGAVPKLKDPAMLCGSMFGMSRTYRHRFFEISGFTLAPPPHPEHTAPQVKMGRSPGPGERIQAIGNFSGVGLVKADWGVTWMNRDGLREAVPPAYTEWIGRAFLAQRADIG